MSNDSALEVINLRKNRCNDDYSNDTLNVFFNLVNYIKINYPSTTS